MRVEVLRAVRRAQAAVREGVPEGRDLVMLLLQVNGCGSREDAREAARRLVAAFPESTRPGKPLARGLPRPLQQPGRTGRTDDEATE